MNRTYLGFDPGGFLAFGWCTLSVAGDNEDIEIQSGTCSSASEALSAAATNIAGIPTAIGIDAPMYWSPDGDRKADQIVRGMVLSKGGQSGTVSAVNSLRGACLAQGIMVATLSQERWPDAAITESHPKALLRIYSDAEKFLSGMEFSNEHERDAALGAYAARALDQRTTGWSDLRTRETNIFDPITHPSPAYWFPTN